MPVLSAGTRLDRYEITGPLGAGGMGEVYLAEDTRLRRRVALKVLPAADQRNVLARKRLEREARAAASLDHPHICAIYEVGEADGLTYIAMQYVEGQTLAARLASGPIELSEMLAIATQLGDALADAHGHAILHRDIKPSNLMLTSRGQLKVMDFGLAKLGLTDHEGSANVETMSQLSTPGAVIGTVPYMSPEQFRGGVLDQRSDLFSVGVVLYEMICGRRPFDEPTGAATAAAILTQEPQPLSRFSTGAPAELERIVTKTLRKDPDQRYQTANDLLIDLQALHEAHAVAERPRSPQRRSRLGIAVGTLVVIGALAAGGWSLKQRMNRQWALAQLPQIASLERAGRIFDAFDLAAQVERYLPGNPTLAGLLPAIAGTVSVSSVPPGATVFVRRFAPDTAGHLPARYAIGTTPIKDVRIARGEYVLSLELPGYAPYERTISNANLRMSALVITPPPFQTDVQLRPTGSVPTDMTFVPGGDYRLVAYSRPTDRRVPLDDYFIDKFEVSNQQYRAFISGGGYVKREYWTEPFVKDGARLSWENAMALLVDRTGLPGPRSWSNQEAPSGEADRPVTDISWFEAAAYAAFRGHQLPTVFQWEKAARNGIVAPAGIQFMPWGPFNAGDTLDLRANFGHRTWPVTSAPFGMSPFGAYNMAGNVSEWTRNDSAEGYMATGGAWGEPLYTFGQYGGRPGFYSAGNLGFRLAHPAGSDTRDQGGGRLESSGEIPVYTANSPAAFNALAAKYRSDAAPLDARVEESVTTQDWTRERISFASPSGDRATAYLYLPHHTPGPLQTLHFVPAGDVDSGLRSLPASMEDRMGPFIRSGRAAFGVVLTGYLGRTPSGGVSMPDSGTVEYFERTAGRIADLRRGLDYLETRADLDRSKIAFFGPSRGAQLGLILAAIEPRYRAVVLVGAGLPRSWLNVIESANPIHFAGHIRTTKLIVQGRYDEDTNLRTAAEPLFRLLPEPKKLVLFEGGHVPANDVLLAATLPWLNDTLGRVRR
jgi:formylglycine-generating enzyme required for sulfatase activity